MSEMGQNLSRFSKVDLPPYQVVGYALEVSRVPLHMEELSEKDIPKRTCSRLQLIP